MTIAPTFDVTVRKTYWENGYFYVPKDHSHLFARTGQIEVALPGRTAPVRGRVYRPPNDHQTWIDGRQALRDWFQKTPHWDYVIRVQVQRKDRIDIALA